MAKKTHKSYGSNLLYNLLRPFAALVFKLRFKTSFHIDESVRELSGSFLLLGNHVNQWDPFIASAGIGRLIRFIASDFVFRKPFLAWLLGSLGAVPKAKFRSDMASLRALMDIRSQGEIIGVFPEGHTNWSGRTLPIVPSTAKLVKLLKIPVVSLKIEGGFASMPRWRGRLLSPGASYRFSLMMGAEEIRGLGLDEINERIQKSLDHDEWQFLRMNPRRFPPVDRAAGYDQVLFICPVCKNIGSIVSHNNGFSCTACGTSEQVDEQGAFSHLKFSEKFIDMGQWDIWQQKYLAETILESDGSQPILEDSSARLAYADDGRNFSRHSDWGRLVLEKNCLRHMASGTQEDLRIGFERISGIAVQNNEKLEFYVGNTLTRLEFLNPAVSTYKWYSAFHHSQIKTDHEH